MRIKNYFLILVILLFSSSFLSLPNSIINTKQKFDDSSPPQLSASLEWVYDGVEICTAVQTQYQIQAIPDGEEGAIIAWVDNRNSGTTGYDIYAQRVDEHGNVLWTTDGVAICTASNTQDYVVLTSDGQGGAIIAWSDQRTSGTTQKDIYAQRIDANGNTKWTANGSAICTFTSDQYRPQIVSDGQGGAIIAWLDVRGVTYPNIYGQRIDASGNTQWTANGKVICDAADSQTQHVMESDGQGGAFIAWVDNRNDFTSEEDIYVQRIDNDGNPPSGWISNGIAICNATYRQEDLDMCSDGVGGVIVTWEDTRPVANNWDIYAQRVNSTGKVYWTANGTLICNSIGSQYFPKSVSDGQGGAIIIWLNYSNSNLLAQRVDESGTTLWTGSGVAVSPSTNAKGYYEISSDGRGGAVVFWSEIATGNYDVYGQRLNPADGSKNWTASGVLVSSATGAQYANAICTDAYGDSIVVWRDQRTGYSDVYAQGVESTGEILIRDDNIPTKTMNVDITTYVGTTAYLNFTIVDDFGAGKYRVLVNNITGTWFDWTNNTVIEYPIDTSVAGTFNYTIQYYDSTGQYGVPETVIVRILSRQLFIEMLNETFTETIFNFTFRIIDQNRASIEDANIEFWWNEVEFTGNMTELGSGLYKINVTAIPVAPNEDPILLNMTITKSGYNSLYYEKNIAVDPESIKGLTPSFWDQYQTVLIVGIGIIIGVIGLYIVIHSTKKRK